jgi:hypothetical protein
MLGGFRFRFENQKSYEQRDQYMKQVSELLAKEKRGALSLLFYRLLVGSAKAVPKKKWRNKLLANILNLPPKIIFDREQGMVFSKRNDF